MPILQELITMRGDNLYERGEFVRFSRFDDPRQATYYRALHPTALPIDDQDYARHIANLFDRGYVTIHSLPDGEYQATTSMRPADLHTIKKSLKSLKLEV